MAKAKAVKKVTPAVLSQLVEIADGVLSKDFCNGFMYRAEEDRAWFFGERKTLDGNISPKESQFRESLRFGQLWKDSDYAFRVLMMPEHRTAMAADLERFNTNRIEALAAKKEGIAPTYDVAAAVALCNEVLDNLARAQPADVIMGCEYDDGFFDAFLDVMVDYITTGEIPDIEDYV
jgi:hypothetical protein